MGVGGCVRGSEDFLMSASVGARCYYYGVLGIGDYVSGTGKR